MIFKDKMNRLHEAFKMGMGVLFNETVNVPGTVKGDVFMELKDAETGEVLETRHIPNIITLDAGILVAILCKDKSSRTNNINMLAVGTGATGALLSPDAPDNRQRKLNAEIERKAFSSTTFRDASGNSVAYPTNIVDFTTIFGEAEAVGPLNEMSLLSTISDNTSVQNLNPDTFPARDTTRDLSTYDISVNYLTFAVMTKPSTAVLTITWRLSF